MPPAAWYSPSDPPPTDTADVIIVGGGNAAFCGAHAARERGASVLMLEKSGPDEAGGNSFYTAGAFRFAHHGINDLLSLLDAPDDARLPHTTLPPYPPDEFLADMRRLTDDRCDPALTDRLVHDSAEVIHWLADKGLRWELLYQRQTYRSDDQWVFFGGLCLGTVDGGKGLIAQHAAAAERSEVDIRYRATVFDLIRDPHGAVIGVRYRDEAGFEHAALADAVILAGGGFEASVDRRARYLGAGWENAIVRGTPMNTGEILDLALAHGAAPHGDWSSCHSVQWDANAPSGGGHRELTNQLTRQSYPVGIVVNRDGMRFIDEGLDYRNFTYAKYGREVLKQPGGLAFQLFDAKTRPLLRTHEYDSAPITGSTADTIPELARSLGIDAASLTRTVSEFNSSIVDNVFDPTVKDARAALVSPRKSNWASALDTPPYYGYTVACGITFTFGGVRVDPDSGQVADTSGAPISGLYAAGELVGGLFHGNYPGGSGLTAGAILGRVAGYSAAKAVQ